MQEIYNEGRVVGLSAYEVYVRHHMEEYGDDPDNPPASERAWLASSISLGTSVLIQVNPDMTSSTKVTWSGKETSGDVNDEGQYWVVEISMSDKQRLCAANTIIGSLFLGNAHLDSNTQPFCDYVTDYGFLSTNTHYSNYEAITDNKIYPDRIDNYDQQVKDYMKIVDGAIIHPSKDYTKYVPDLHKSSKIRIMFRKLPTAAFYILLSGFTDGSIISGTSIHMEGAISGGNKENNITPNTDHAYRGDFLGPEVFPWSTKISFITPPIALSRLFVNNFRRTLDTYTVAEDHTRVTGGSTNVVIDKDPLLDFNHAYLEKFYDNGNSKLANRTSRVKENVDNYASMGEGLNQLSVISKDSGVYDLPGLYGKSSTAEGDQYLYPIDCHAPGTVKAFPPGTSDEEHKAFPKNRPGSYQIIINKDGTIQVVTIDNGNAQKMPVASMDVKKFTGATDKIGYYAVQRIGVLKDSEGNPYTVNNQYIPKWVRVPVISSNGLRSDDGCDGKSVQDGAIVAKDSDYTAILNSSDQIEDSATDEGVNFISLRTLSYAFDQNKRLDLLGQSMRKFRDGLTSRAVPSSAYYSEKYNPAANDANAGKSTGLTPGYSASTEAIPDVITVKNPLELENTLFAKNDIQINGHLQLKWHSPRNKAACGYVLKGSEQAAYDHIPAELHIDAVSTGDTAGLGSVNNFAIGLGFVKEAEGEKRRDNLPGQANWTDNKHNNNTGSISGEASGYVTMMNGLRLYISNKEPIDGDIPIGSIGIGWGR